MNTHEIAQAIVCHRQNIRDTRERIAWLYGDVDERIRWNNLDVVRWHFLGRRK